MFDITVNTNKTIKDGHGITPLFPACFDFIGVIESDTFKGFNLYQDFNNKFYIIIFGRDTKMPFNVTIKE